MIQPTTKAARARLRRATVALVTSAAMVTSILPAQAAEYEETTPLSLPMQRWLNRTPNLQIVPEVSNDFNNGMPKNYRPLERDSFRNPNQIQSASNTSVHNGMMDIRTRRHCVDKKTDPLTDENAQEAPCPADKIAMYSGSRFYSPWFEGGNFRMTIRAKFDATERVDGVRPSLWLLNDSGWCSGRNSEEQYGELDMVEAYSDRPNGHWSVAHIGCNQYRERPAAVRRISQIDDAFGTWHDYSVEVFDGNVVFTMDGRVLGTGGISADDFPIVTHSEFQTALNHRWHLILNTLIEGGVDGHWVKSVDETKPFPEHHFLIDYVKLEHEVDENGNYYKPKIPENGFLEEESADLSAQMPDQKQPSLKKMLAGLTLALGAIAGLFFVVPSLRAIAQDFLRQFPAAEQLGLVQLFDQ